MTTLRPRRGSPNRRNFLHAVAGAAVVAPTLSPQGRAAAPANSLIDAHSHIWSRDVARFPLRKDTDLADLAPPSFSIDALLKLTAANRVGRVVLIQHHLFHGYDNSYLLHAAAKHPNVFRVVGMVDDRGPDPAMEMKKLLRSHVTGFRITSWIRKEGLAERRWHAIDVAKCRGHWAGYLLPHGSARPPVPGRHVWTSPQDARGRRPFRPHRGRRQNTRPGHR